MRPILLREGVQGPTDVPVTCTKCRVWGTQQIIGVAVSLRRRDTRHNKDKPTHNLRTDTRGNSDTRQGISYAAVVAQQEKTQHTIKDPV